MRNTPSSPFASACSSESASSTLTRADTPWPPSNPTSMRMRSAICHQFREDAVDGARVDERYLETEEPRVRLGVDQVPACRAEPRELGPHVVDPVRDGMHARPALRQEAPHRRVVAERLDQLDPAVAYTDGCRIDALVVDLRAVLQLGPEQVEVRVQRSVEVGDGEPDVVNGPRRHEGGS